tara:strand:+ start:1250 stop:2092 length:843 start_codon:yes stop_codon:yes gene_type:complete
MKRIIAKLDIKGFDLVKGINLEGLRVLGDPSKFARKYYENSADEILYHDCVASLYSRKNFLSLIEKISSGIFIPISAGGGITTLKDIEKTLSSGADKVFINSAAIKRPKFLDEACKKFGSANICLSIEAIKNQDENFICLSDFGRQQSKRRLLDWINESQDRGVGEIILTSVRNEGIGKGFDIEMLNLVYDKIKVPLVIHGGAGNEKDIYEVLKLDKVSGVAISSLIHYNLVKNKYFNLNLKSSGNTEFLKFLKNTIESKNSNILSIKKYLKKNGVRVRL